MNKKTEQTVLDNFYYKVKGRIQEAQNYNDEEADFYTYRWFLQNTELPPTNFFKIFSSIPEKSQKKILKHLGYKSTADFKKTFSTHLNSYRQNAFRREEGENSEI